MKSAKAKGTLPQSESGSCKEVLVQRGYTRALNTVQDEQIGNRRDRRTSRACTDSNPLYDFAVISQLYRPVKQNSYPVLMNASMVSAEPSVE